MTKKEARMIVDALQSACEEALGKGVCKWDLINESYMLLGKIEQGERT